MEGIGRRCGVFDK